MFKMFKKYDKMTMDVDAYKEIGDEARGLET